MIPHDVAVDSSRILQFQHEVAYLDRMVPSEAEVHDDSELLTSKDGVLVIAWLWPSPIYELEFDPFEAAARMNQTLWEKAATDLQKVGAEQALKTASRAFDRQRERRRQVVASRFVRILESTARAAGRSVDDLKTHVRWSAPLSQLELHRLLHAHVPFSFPVIVSLCSALQLEFAEAWVLADPERLARRIDQSVLANGISDHLHFLALENLESVARKLPRGSADTGQVLELEIYRAPLPGSRYWSLYEALAGDERDSPDYTLAEIDRILVDAGEMHLPDSARTRADRSWWAGSGARTQGRPQVGAWWAAGYRIRHLEIDPSSSRIASIGFEALPGRAQWLASPERTVRREYRVPGPMKVAIYPELEVLNAGLTEFARLLEAHTKGGDLRGITAGLTEFAALLEAQTKELDLEGARAGLTGMAAALERLSDLNLSRIDSLAQVEANVPDDFNVRGLTEFLKLQGEADRSQIESHFSQLRDAPVDPAWMTNLLTKARRQGWIINNGTRSQPRWTITRLTVPLNPST